MLAMAAEQRLLSAVVPSSSNENSCRASHAVLHQACCCFCGTAARPLEASSRLLDTPSCRVAVCSGAGALPQGSPAASCSSFCRTAMLVLPVLLEPSACRSQKASTHTPMVSLHAAVSCMHTGSTSAQQMRAMVTRVDLPNSQLRTCVGVAGVAASAPGCCHCCCCCPGGGAWQVLLLPCCASSRCSCWLVACRPACTNQTKVSSASALVNNMAQATTCVLCTPATKCTMQARNSLNGVQAIGPLLCERAPPAHVRRCVAVSDTPTCTSCTNWLACSAGVLAASSACCCSCPC